MLNIRLMLQLFVASASDDRAVTDYIAIILGKRIQILKNKSTYTITLWASVRTKETTQEFIWLLQILISILSIHFKQTNNTETIFTSKLLGSEQIH